MDSNNNAELKTEQNKYLLSNASTSSIDSKSTCSTASFKDINESPDNILENTSYIKEVYSYNYKQELVEQFIKNFDKIDIFMDNIYQNLKREKKKTEIKEYLDRVSVLCLNYKQSFEKKYERKDKNSMDK